MRLFDFFKSANSLDMSSGAGASPSPTPPTPAPLEKSILNRADIPAPDAGARAQKSLPPAGAAFLPSTKTAYLLGDTMQTMHRRPLLTDLTKIAFDETSRRMAVAAAQVQQEEKLASDQVRQTAISSIPSDYADKLASACEFAATTIKTANFGPGEGPGVLTVTDSANNAKMPGPGQQGHGTQLPPSDPKMQAALDAARTQLQNTINDPPGGGGHQTAALTAAKTAMYRTMRKIAAPPGPPIPLSEPSPQSLLERYANSGPTPAVGGTLADGIPSERTAYGQKIKAKVREMAADRMMMAQPEGMLDALAPTERPRPHTPTLNMFPGDLAQGPAHTPTPAPIALQSATPTLHGLSPAAAAAVTEAAPAAAAPAAAKAESAVAKAVQEDPGVLQRMVGFAKRHPVGTTLGALGAAAGTAYGVNELMKDAARRKFARMKRAADGAPEINQALQPGGHPLGGSPSGNTSLMSSNDSAMNYKRQQAYAGRKQELSSYFNEPALSSAHDTTLQQAFAHTGEAGTKLSFDKAAQVSAAVLLRDLANQAALETNGRKGY